MSKSIEDQFYEAFSQPADPLVGHEPTWELLYRWPSEPKNDVLTVTAPFYGDVVNEETGKVNNTNQVDIAYTTWGDKGIPVIMLHGVPTNRRQYYPMQKRLARFCRTLSFDMLGMGESSKIRNYGFTENDGSQEAWSWLYDLTYIAELIKTVFPREKVVFVADDWGGGILAHAIERLQDLLLGAVFIDPVAFDGYPVSEIQAFGRGSMLPDEKIAELFGGADQTMVQIFKTMVYDQNTYNQYNLRDYKFPYIDTDYERSEFRDGEDATSMTLRLKLDAMKNLMDRASILSSALLLPYSKIMNPKGVQYNTVEIPILVLWGEDDNMMPATQLYRYMWAMPEARVSVKYIPRVVILRPRINRI